MKSHTQLIADRSMKMTTIDDIIHFNQLMKAFQTLDDNVQLNDSTVSNKFGACDEPD